MNIYFFRYLKTTVDKERAIFIRKILNQLKFQWSSVCPVHLASIKPTDRLKIHGGEAFQNIFVACVW